MKKVIVTIECDDMYNIGQAVCMLGFPKCINDTEFLDGYKECMENISLEQIRNMWINKMEELEIDIRNFVIVEDYDEF